MIALVDYGSGNIQAIANIYHRLGIPAYVASTPEDLQRATRIVLPGVGAFDQTMGHLNASGLRDALDEAVLGQKRPFLGICVGMQLLARGSEEGKLEGLGWLKADVKRFDETQFLQATRLPHMGWNDIIVRQQQPLLEGLALEAGFYFLHSYYLSCQRQEDVLAETEYGSPFPSAVHSGNIFGVQFHPEKSHANGIQLLKNFATL